MNSNLTAFLPYEFYRVDEEIMDHVMDYKWAIFFTILGTLLLDFSADTSQMPARAYLLDVCLPGGNRVRIELNALVGLTPTDLATLRTWNKS